MGQTLSEPVTAKNTACCQNVKYRVGSSSMQGWRVTMEDAHTHILELPDDHQAAYFGVFDGHGGSKVSEYAGKHLHKYITAREEYKNGNIEESMRQAYLEIDRVMMSNEQIRSEQSGTTAVTIIIKNNKLYCANVGDSRAIGSVNGRVIELSFDHKPNNPEEYDRIIAAGGWVDFNRVNGNLALSRALGDYIFKQNTDKLPKEQIVTAYPEVTVHPVTQEWEFLVIACDGIWDVMSNEEVLLFVRERIGLGYEPEEICENLMDLCLAPDCQMAGLGCDNMTVIIVAILNGRTYEELAKKCSNTK